MIRHTMPSLKTTAAPARPIPRAIKRMKAPFGQREGYSSPPPRGNTPDQEWDRRKIDQGECRREILPIAAPTHRPIEQHHRGTRQVARHPSQQENFCPTRG